MDAAYLDSSALVKLLVSEPESAALRHYLRNRRPLISSALARTEVLRAVQPAGEHLVSRGRRLLARLDLVRVGNDILDAAGRLSPHELRSLDAIHLATAQRLGHDLSVLVTYDRRMADSAEALGLRTSAPA